MTIASPTWTILPGLVRGLGSWYGPEPVFIVVSALAPGSPSGDLGPIRWADLVRLAESAADEVVDLPVPEYEPDASPVGPPAVGDRPFLTRVRGRIHHRS